MNYARGQDFIRSEWGCVCYERGYLGRCGRRGGQGEQYRCVCVLGGEAVRVDRLMEELHVCGLARSRERSLQHRHEGELESAVCVSSRFLHLASL
jgi:hypothetical protein